MLQFNPYHDWPLLSDADYERMEEDIVYAQEVVVLMEESNKNGDG